MIDTPVVVRTLAEREHLILQRVSIVANNTELDVDAGAGRHIVWYDYVEYP